jgi:tyrosyl-tRNA synthetase
VRDVLEKGGNIGAHRVLARLVAGAYAPELIPTRIDAALYSELGYALSAGGTDLDSGLNETVKNAEARFYAISRGGIPADIKSILIPQEEFTDGKIGVVKLFTLSGLCASNGESKRMIEQKGLKIDSETVTDTKLELALEGAVVLQRGKDKFVRVERA